MPLWHEPFSVADRTADGCARVTRLACPAVPVCGRLIGCVRPFGRQTVNGWQGRILPGRIDQIIPSTRLFPIHRSLDESSASGIMMQVVDGGQDCGRPGEVSVVAWTFLPVTKRPHSRTLVERQPFQQLAPGLNEQLSDAIGRRPFDGFQQGVDSVCFGERIDHQISVLGHEDEGGQPITMAFHCPINALGQRPSPHVVGQ
jgi:hypothetical protein